MLGLASVVKFMIISSTVLSIYLKLVPLKCVYIAHFPSRYLLPLIYQNSMITYYKLYYNYMIKTFLDIRVHMHSSISSRDTNHGPNTDRNIKGHIYTDAECMI